MPDNQEQKDRIKLYIESLNIPVRKFEEICGLSNGYISSIRKGIGHKAIGQISEHYTDLNTGWLLTGDGEMLKSDKNTSSKDNNKHIPLIPISAQGGSLNDFVLSVREEDCERILSPITDAEYAISVAGDSMAPEYPSGCQVLIKKINERAFIDWGKVYVLDTCNGSIIKKLMPPKDENTERVRCVSINSDYPPFEIDLLDIYGVYRVLLCMSLK